jgi:hypothetical protein
MADTLPPALRKDHAAHERRYGQLWAGILSDAQHDGAVDAALDTRALRDIVLGALNSTLSTAHGSDVAHGRIVSSLMRLILM